MATEQIHTYCAMCVSKCGVVATVEDGQFTKVTPDPEHPNGCICTKGTAAPEIVYAPDRLQYPMKRTRPKGDPVPGWIRISWDEALALVASCLQDIKTQYGAEAVVFGSATPAGSASSDFWDWAWRLAHAFGSPNLMCYAHICNWHRATGSRYTYGVGTPQPDYDQTRCILLWGHNPAVSWPAAAARISRARARGAKLIVIDPRQHGLAQKADCWLQVRPGSDGALALSMIHVLLEEDLYDATFVRDWTNGTLLVREDTGLLLTERDLLPSGDAETFIIWDHQRGGPVGYHPDTGYAQDGVQPALTGVYTCALAEGAEVQCRPAFESLKELAAEYAPERSERMTGVAAEDVRRAVRLFATEKPSCYFSWVGLEQHANATQTNRAMNLFYTLTGQFDTPGSNVIFASPRINPAFGWELLAREQAARRLGAAERPLGPAGTTLAQINEVQAYDVYRAILTGQPYPVKGMLLFGSDPLLSHGYTAQGKAALQALDFYVHVDLFANPSATYADLLLPASSCWESEGLMSSFRVAEGTATWTQFRQAIVPPQYESRPDIEIIFDLANRLGLGKHFFDGDMEAARNHQLAPSGFTVQQLREHPLGMRSEGRTRHRKYAAIDARTGQPRGFATPTRKVEVYSTHFARAGYAPLPVYQESTSPLSSGSAMDPRYPLMLTFSRLVQYCDSQHRNIPRLRRQVREPLLEIHPEIAESLGIKDGDWVSVETAAGKISLKAKFNPAVHATVVCTTYGWWQGCEALGLPGYDPLGTSGANANRLIANDVIDPISGSVPHRSQMCRVRKKITPAS
jgi:anaerobic selenocysteine-containing dehydrogenase